MHMFWNRSNNHDPDTLLRNEAVKFAQGLAKAQVQSSKTLFYSGNFDEKNVENGWRQVLLARPGYDEQKVNEVIETTKFACQSHGAPYNFRAIILGLAAYEFQERTGFDADDFEDELRTGVDSVLAKYR